VNTPLLCALALLATDPALTTKPMYRGEQLFAAAVSQEPAAPVVVRAQDSPFYGGGGTPPTYTPPGSVVTPQPGSPGMTDPFLGGGIQPYNPSMGDPFSGGGAAPAPYGYNPFAPPAAAGYTFGLNGPQPFRYGWESRYDFGYMPSTGTSSPDVGDFGIFEFDVEKELATPLGSGYTFSIAPQFGFRAWEGPLGALVGNAGLPGQAYRLGLGLKLLTPNWGPWQFEVGFNPAIATDFDDVSSDAWLFDGHAVAFYRTSPQFMWAIGAAYWDRVDNIILPYAGVVWTPNDYWEFRLLFPKPRITWFAGAPMGVPTWLYVAGEYHVEAYEVNVDPINQSTRVQIEDIRVLGGARAEFGAVTGFLEAGWVFNRDVDFDAGFGTDFEIDNGFIARAGFRY
jgi:hypothetical protein